MHLARKQTAYIVKEKIQKDKKKRDGGVGPGVGWQGLQHASPSETEGGTCGGSNL